MADDSKKKAYSIASCYKVEGDKIVERPKQSPKKPGCFMANHKDRLTCGATGYTEIKSQN